MSNTPASNNDDDVIRPARDRLIELAVEMRPDWDAGEFTDGLSQCLVHGWAWRRIYREAFIALNDPRATAGCLLAALGPVHGRRRPAA